jgi:ABC-type uncharacterized transport system permease subunit
MCTIMFVPFEAKYLTPLAVVTKEPMSARIIQNVGLQIEWKIISYSTLIDLR